MHYSSYTDPGSRKNNEDFLLFGSVGSRHLFVVNDGVGGAAAGELAAKAAAEEIKQQFLRFPHTFRLKNAVSAANDRVFRLQQETGKNMKTTVAVVCTTGRKIRCSHVGDSRIYLFSDDTIIYRSLDHSVSQEAVNRGEITEDEIRSYPSRNVLTKALGVWADLTAEVTTFPMRSVKAMLLCTDGFWEYVYEDEMISLLRVAENPQQWLQAMRSLLEERIGVKNDNNTAIAVFC